mgnify:CR=1 FL=1
MSAAAFPWHGAGRRVFIQEVGTRDGLQRSEEHTSELQSQR